MSRPTLYCAVTGHGFGHAVRMACIADKIQQACPEVLLILATQSPRWLLESYIEGDFIHRPVALDVGVIQSDSLCMDLEATHRALSDIYAQKSRLIAAESNYLQNNRVDLVLADIPALAVPIAEKAQVPCWMVSNFGWNFIYRDWGESFQAIAEEIERDYQRCDQLFRLPLCEPMSIFPRIIDVGLTGGTPRHSEANLRSSFALTAPPEKTALLSFGGLGLAAIPYATLEQFPDWQFIGFDRQATPQENLTIITDHNYRPVDLMPLCGRVISKPGYSTFAEALRLGIPLVSLTREGFAEASVLLEGLQNYGHHQIVETQDFFAGNWSFLAQSPRAPRLDHPLDPHGAEAIAARVLEYLMTE